MLGPVRNPFIQTGAGCCAVPSPAFVWHAGRGTPFRRIRRHTRDEEAGTLRAYGASGHGRRLPIEACMRQINHGRNTTNIMLSLWTWTLCCREGLRLTRNMKSPRQNVGFSNSGETLRPSTSESFASVPALSPFFTTEGTLESLLSTDSLATAGVTLSRSRLLPLGHSAMAGPSC